MPKLDKTGPLGYGPLTGWGLGPCGQGLGLKRGYGYGRGFGRPWTRSEMLKALKGEKEILKEELTEIDEEIKSLGNQK